MKTLAHVDLETALDQMETYSEEEIRQLMVRSGKKGVRSDVNCCVLAVYFADVTGQEVAVGNEMVDEAFEMTLAMREFVSNFDLGEYPELECPE